ncbi:MAG: copper chaperone PCu(A)C [Sphingobium phenoxybenzoativorans]
MGAFSRISAACALLASTLLLAACADPPPLYVDQAWVRLSANPDSPSAGYFVVHGGPAPVTLRGVMSDYAQRIEMHESMAMGGMMTMKPVDKVDIPAGQTVAFEPGGKHIMLFRINQNAVTQGKIPLTFLFSNGDRIQFDAVIQKTGEPAPAAKEGGSGHAGNASGAAH